MEFLAAIGVLSLLFLLYKCIPVYVNFTISWGQKRSYTIEFGEDIIRNSTNAESRSDI